MTNHATSKIAILIASVLALHAGDSYSAATTDRDFHVKGYERFIKRWSSGALVVRQVDQSAAPEIAVLDSSGSVDSFPLAIEGAALTAVWDVARNEHGSLAACGFSMDRDGRSTPFLAFISTASRRIQVVRTGPYSCSQIVLEADGSVWTSGLDTTDRTKHVDETAMVIRHFSGSGEAIGGFVKQQSIRKRGDISSPRNRLVAYKDGVVWFSPGDGRLIQVTSNRVLKDLSGITVPDSPWKVEGFAIIDSGDAYLATAGTESTQLWKLNEVTKSFQSVKTGEHFGILYGSDQNSLVFAHPSDLSKIRFHQVD